MQDGLQVPARCGGFVDALVEQAIDAAYDSVLAEEGWQRVLGVLARLFRCHFADVFARTDDRSRFHGVAQRMDRAEYEDVFLGQWVARNVWGTRRPVRVAGEIVTTRQMVTRDELLRSEMYNDFLSPRGLHEGLRLAIWAGGGWIQDISLLRPWSKGPFEGQELAAARTVLPHLQRAAAIERRLGAAQAMAAAGLGALDAVPTGVFVLDSEGGVLWHNAAAAALLGDGVRLQRAQQAGEAGRRDGLRAAADQDSRRLASAVDRATRGADGVRRSDSLLVGRPSGRAPLAVLTLPVRGGGGWAWLPAPAALVLVGDGQAGAPQAAALAALFGLTGAESELAVELLAGHSLAQVAAARGRSVHTVRSQLARLMAKTETNRQSDLLRVLLSAPKPGPDLPDSR